ncbi:putative uncharacterized protein [Waddlia chondrophila 2032/99]|uniref:Uncharacterized protein n=2 Tax=Waddlia chondrophila TaxID=71667 RepID=D6YUI3_WADCW|nr:hypothetical protein [Waddlia chondrophila]ADI37794.1 hypothetical protein wcw_0422 [Waddlia chondrophila WSU 86-1044]CCB91845.1 putative uncharacterized protein [Waddlia chondrophila 2032/99]
MINIKPRVYHWLLVGLFAATPFFMPQATAETTVPNKGQEIASSGFGIYFGGSPRYYRHHDRYRYYPRNHYRYQPRYYHHYRDPYYGPYYRYHYYPRGGAGVYFRIR